MIYSVPVYFDCEAADQTEAAQKVVDFLNAIRVGNTDFDNGVAQAQIGEPEAVE